MHTHPPSLFGKTALLALLFALACQKDAAPPPTATDLPDLSRTGERLSEIQGFVEKKEWAAAWPIARSLAEDLLKWPAVPQDSSIRRLNRQFYKIGGGLSMGKKFDLSILSFELGLRLVQKRPDLFPLAIAANKIHLALELNRLGQNREAIDLYEQAAATLESMKTPTADSLLGWNLNKLGALYLGQGDYREAIRFFSKNLEITKNLPFWKSKQSYALCDLAICHAGLGDLERARSCMDKGLKLIEDPKFQKYYRASMSSQFGGLLLQSGRPREALDYFENQKKDWGKTATEIQKAEWADIFGNIGTAKLALGDFAGARAALDESLRLLGEVFPAESPEKGQAFLKKAQLFVQKGDLSAALENIDRAIPQFEKTNSATGDGRFANHLFEIFAQKAVVEFQLFEQKKAGADGLAQSVRSFEKASGLLDRLRGDFADARSKMELTARATAFYESAIEAADAAQRLGTDPKGWEKAFFFAEKSKSVQLLAASRETQAQELAGVSEGFRLADRNLKLKLAGWQNALEKAIAAGLDADSPDLKAARDSVFSLKNEQRKLLAAIKTQFPNYFKNKMDVRVVSVAELEKALSKRPGTALVEWFWGEKNVWAFRVDSETGLSCAKQPIDGPLLSGIDSVWQALRNPPVPMERNLEKMAVDNFAWQSNLLFERLVRPVFGDEGLPKNLVFVPDGPLGRLPFEALVAEKNAASGQWRTLPYLMGQSVVSYAFSATLFLEKKLASRAAKPLAAFAPDYKNTGGPLALNRSDSGHEMVVFPGLRSGFQPLANNRPEAAQVAGLAGGTAFLGERATETDFKKVAGDFQKLHFAMHALPNDSLPELSQLVFSETGDTVDDGRLYAWELCGLPLDADLVTLSACETGAGRVQRGEGVQSLARAFRQAGCPNLVMSLWQADDISTKEVMRLFYQKLAEAPDQSAALASAKRAFLTGTEEGRLTHPFYWATFVHTGCLGTEAPARWSLGLIAACSGLLLALLFWRLRKRAASRNQA